MGAKTKLIRKALDVIRSDRISQAARLAARQDAPEVLARWDRLAEGGEAARLAGVRPPDNYGEDAARLTLPDGSRIVYRGDESGAPQIFESYGSGQRMQVIDPGGRYQYPSPYEDAEMSRGIGTRPMRRVDRAGNRIDDPEALRAPLERELVDLERLPNLTPEQQSRRQGLLSALREIDQMAIAGAAMTGAMVAPGPAEAGMRPVIPEREKYQNPVPRAINMTRPDMGLTDFDQRVAGYLAGAFEKLNKLTNDAAESVDNAFFLDNGPAQFLFRDRLKPLAEMQRYREADKVPPPQVTGGALLELIP